MTEFKIGDRVSTDHRGAGEIAFGPYNSGLGTSSRYLVKLDSGVHASFGASFVKPEVPALSIGMSVTFRQSNHRHVIVAGPFVSTFRDQNFWVVADENGKHGAPFEESITPAPIAPNEYEHNGVVYDLTAGYRDRDGDDWAFSGQHAGEPVMNCSRMTGQYYRGRPLSKVVQTYGPLTKIC